MRKKLFALVGPALVGALALVPAVASTASAAPNPVVAKPAVARVMPHNRADYDRGFRDGQRFGFRDGDFAARQSCRRGYVRTRPGWDDYSRGYRDSYNRGYDSGFQTGYRTFCMHRR